MRVRLDLSYDGTGFAGWAAQPTQRTVQGELEAAIRQILQRDDLPHLVVAGRTDAGVHARGQVAHLDLSPDPRVIHADVGVVSASQSTSSSASIMEGEATGVPAGMPLRRDSQPSEAPPRLAGASADASVSWAEAVPALHPGSPLPPVPGTTAELVEDLRNGGRDQLLRRLNGTLPHDIRIRRASVAPADFDARFCGISRTYSYRIADHPGAVDPLRRHDTLHWPRPLELSVMQLASAELIGLHDFAAFCKRREGASTIRNLLRLDWVRDDAGVLVATVQADAFCHSMVRSLVGALIAVGEARHPTAWPASLLSLDLRASGVLVAPPQGLTLEQVEYPSDDQLAARQLVTRRPRG